MDIESGFESLNKAKGEDETFITRRDYTNFTFAGRDSINLYELYRGMRKQVAARYRLLRRY